MTGVQTCALPICFPVTIPSSRPFITDTNAWTKLGLKTALKEAVAQGAERIAWTTGEQQNERYDLSKQLSMLYYKKNSDGTFGLKGVVSGSGDEISVGEKIPENKLPDYIGKEVAEKVSKNDAPSSKFDDGYKFLKGEDLKVGGKGMKGFYGEPSQVYWDHSHHL